ncbi:MAG: gluconate 2-dehydrogenase subunit 3 family protein [Deltaproteobacteria bacterium]|nr:MAG: gluconate 2-dehydrogenase subunit 3 family protein [Deltaproteobacteria bacterium]
MGEPLRPRLFGHPISRRGFLVRSGGAAAALALAGCFGDGGEGYYRSLLPADDAPLALPLREYAVLQAAARRIVPGGVEHPSTGEVRVAARVDRELGFHSERLRRDVRDALRLIEWSPLLTHFARFTQLRADEQDAVLRAMQQSRLAIRRSAFAGIKLLVVFMYYTAEPAWPSIGYDGPWVPRGPDVTWV